jgi:hypothetical protein
VTTRTDVTWIVGGPYTEYVGYTEEGAREYHARHGGVLRVMTSTVSTVTLDDGHGGAA